MGLALVSGVYLRLLEVWSKAVRSPEYSSGSACTGLVVRLKTV